jgi:hypothetical protein
MIIGEGVDDGGQVGRLPSEESVKHLIAILAIG